MQRGGMGGGDDEAEGDPSDLGDAWAPDQQMTLGTTSVDVAGDGNADTTDCDDNDPNSTTMATDADCDTHLTAEDCDDNDPASNFTAIDADCDTHLTAADCDDNDPSSTIVAEDNECDGTILPR
mgnify:CR=1 FL=1